VRRVESGGGQSRVAPAVRRQTNVNALRHADGLACPQLHPIHSVQGRVAAEGATAPGHFHPSRAGVALTTPGSEVLPLVVVRTSK